MQPANWRSCCSCARRDILEEPSGNTGVEVPGVQERTQCCCLSGAHSQEQGQGIIAPCAF